MDRALDPCGERPVRPGGAHAADNLRGNAIVETGNRR